MPSLKRDRLGHAGGAEPWLVLLILTVVYALNIADRFVLSTLIEPIKAEFALSDSAIGFLTGVSLAIFYVSAGIPLGILADRVNRRSLLAVSLAVWSLLTMGCGWAQSFWQLLVMRIGVGIGEAGGTPPSQTLLADTFTLGLRPTAMSIFAVGATFGATLGSSAGGWLSDHYGWRSALLCFGAIGLPVALLVRVAIREPVRGRFERDPSQLHKPSVKLSVRFMLGQRSLLHVLAGCTVCTFWSWGIMWWTPAFLSRSHGLSVEAAGALLAPMHGIGGTAAVLLTAWLFHRYSRGDPRWQTWFVAASMVVGFLPSLLVFAVPSLAACSLMLWIFVPLIYVPMGPTLALTQNLVPAGMRALACAFLLFFANLANLAVAPQLLGWASDEIALRLDVPQQSLRYVLAAASLTALWGAWHYARAARTLRVDLAAAGSDTSATTAVPVATKAPTTASLIP